VLRVYHHHGQIDLRQHTYRAGIAKIPQKADIALFSSGEGIWLDSQWTLKDIIL
jgi:hypothetical protein